MDDARAGQREMDEPDKQKIYLVEPEVVTLSPTRSDLVAIR